MPGHALIYVRLSQTRANEPTTSPEKQLEACIGVCQAHDWTYEIYQEPEGWRSGRFEHSRPAWLKLKDRIVSGGVSAIVVYRLDRASRSPKDFFNFMASLQERHIDFVSATQDLDTSSSYGRMFTGLLSLWAALEAEITSDRVRETITWKQVHGIHVGDIPLGYDRVKQAININGEMALTSVLVINEDEAAIVKMIFESYATGNYTYRSLAEHLNSLGYRTKNKQKKPNPFTSKSIQVILGNYLLYTGFLVRNENAPGEEVVKAIHPAIIDLELAQRAREVAQSWHDKLPIRRLNQRLFLLQNLHCALCGQTMRGVTERNGKGVYRHDSVKGKCPVPQGDAERLERQFLETFEGLELSDNQLHQLEKDWMQNAPEQGECQKRERYLEQRGQRTRKLYLVGDISEHEYETEKRSLEQQKTELANEYGPDRGSVVRKIGAVVRELGKAIQGSDTVRQRAIAESMFERIETNGEAITRIVPRRWFKEFFDDLAHLERSRLRPLVPPGDAGQVWGRISFLFEERIVSTGSQPHNAPQVDRNAIIRQLRKDNWSLSDIAERYHLSIQRVWEICRG